MSDSEPEDDTPLPLSQAPPSDNESDDDARPPATSQPAPLSALSMLVNNPLVVEPRKFIIECLLNDLLLIKRQLQNPKQVLQQPRRLLLPRMEHSKDLLRMILYVQCL
jgi:hypothetical protein